MIKTSKNNGFTLIELAAVLTVSGILLVSFGSIITSYMKHSSIVATHDRMERIQIALDEYYRVNNKYPCPASLTADPGHDDYAVETSDDCRTDALGTFRANGFNGGGIENDIRIGALPTQALRLPDIDMLDGWENKFLYAVTIGLTQRETFKQSGGTIAIVDPNDHAVQTPKGTAHYVLVSHGANSHGAYTIYGRPRSGCRVASIEGKNCDNTDSTFTTTIETSDLNNNNQFDDIVAYGVQTKIDSIRDDELMPIGAVVPFNLRNCPSGWAPVPTLAGRVIIGAGDYTASNANDTSHTYSLGQQGGLAKLKLNVAQMAPHTHSFPVRESGTQKAVVETGAGPFVSLLAPYSGPGATQSTYTTAPLGGNVPHENRQHFMAFLYCKKT